jgi:DNA-directed RNA polymerase specialized sigma24 family protein
MTATHLSDPRQRPAARHGESGSDQDLLERYVRHRDPSALAELVERHSGIVWGVCRRLLSSEQDTEDAFCSTMNRMAHCLGRIGTGR